MATRVQNLLFLLVLSTCACFSWAHVALTFPPARKYDLDFLDNSRTPAPCGMPKGNIRTTFVTGSAFNVTWHLSYPHRGGYKIQILDHLERPKLDLTPSIKGSDFVRNDATAQSHEIRLPKNFTCDDCTMRLLRQADEWTNSYRFWSCADIDIKPRKEYRETCSSHGKFIATKCKCDKNYYGSRCQYWDECTVDQDCGLQGSCVDIGGTALPRKQCFCKLGWFGTGCNKKSPVKSTDIDMSLYTTKTLTPDFTIHWRLFKEQKEIEMVLVVNGTSWVGFGWRPKKLTAECRKFPALYDPGFSAVSPEPSSEPEPTSEPTSEPSSEPSGEPKAEHTSESSSKIQEPLALGSSKSKRVAAPQTPKIPTSKDEYTVSTSVSYRVSTVTGGRKKRAAQKSFKKSKKIEDSTTPEPEPNTPAAETEPTVAEPEPTVAEPEPTVAEPEPTVAEPEPTVAEPEPTVAEPEPTSAEPKTTVAEPEPAAPEPKTTVAEPEPTAAEPKTTVAEPEPTAAEPKTTVAEPEPTAAEPKTTVPEPELTSPEPETKSEPKINLKSEKIVEKPSQKQTASKDYTPKHDFNPMDCTDIVIGTARGEMSRVWDYYTRDRSTPRLDTFWGGKSELTATGGFEKDGITTIIFRKKLDANEPTDHSITDDLMHVIWAKGQEPQKYVHFPPSGLEKEQALNPEFYQPDELKYHGHRLQRGYTQINFFDEDKPAQTAASPHELNNECHGHWKTPRDCSAEKHDCEYFISWQTAGKGDDIKFHIETNNTNTWTGVAFSDNQQMSQSDAIIGWFDSRNGRPFLMDTWITGYSAPLLDESQDISAITGSSNNGVTILDFTRKRISNDPQDFSFSDEHCLYMMFPVKGGAFNAVNKKTRKHEDVPIVTSNRVCIKSCGLDSTDYVGETTTPAPNRLAYAVSMKLINLADGFQAPKKGSQEYEDLSKTIQNNFNGVLGDIPGYYKLDEISFNKNDKDVIAKMNVLFDKARYEEGRSLDTDNKKSVDEKDEGKVIEKAIKESLASGKVGSLSVDPNFLDFEPLGIVAAPEESTKSRLAAFFQLSEVRLYTVLGCIAALVIVALLQATCTIMKSSKKSNRHKLIPNSAWKDYSSNTNYAFDAFADHDEKHNGKSRNGANSRSSTATVHNGMSQQTTLQMSHSPNKSQYYDISRNGNRYGGNGEQQHRHSKNVDRHSHPQQQSSYADRSYSLPRTMIQPHNQMAGYYTQDRRNRSSHNPNGNNHNNYNHHRQAPERSNGTDTPDFYFMPSQRKYSGEVVRVYVDYNKDPK